jgi:peptide/nickel transport system permease protein/oligopeptide transport system permease protein
MAERGHRENRGLSPAAQAWRRYRSNPWALGAAWVLGLLVAGVILSAWVLPHAPNALSEAQYGPPSMSHWLGTDASGRDVLARVCAGARVSLAVGLAGALVSLGIGVAWGALAGYAGGRLDGILMRAVDVLYSLPSIVFLIVLVSALREPAQRGLASVFGEGAQDAAGLLFLVIGLGGVSWLTMARMVRAQVRVLKAQAFVEAVRALGAGHFRILFRHLLPGTIGVIVAYGTLTLPAVVLGESFLSFLGLGIQPPQASLGSLIADGAAQVNPVRVRLWLLAGPASVLVTMLLSLSFIGDGLREALDP